MGTSFVSRGRQIVACLLVYLTCCHAAQAAGNKRKTRTIEPGKSTIEAIDERSPALDWRLEATGQATVPAPERPFWEIWLDTLIAGKPLRIFEPPWWGGTWPQLSNPWEIKLDGAYRNYASYGTGPELSVLGNWSIGGLRLEGKSSVLWANGTDFTSWQASLKRDGWSIEWRMWLDGRFRPGELAASASFHRSF